MESLKRPATEAPVDEPASKRPRWPGVNVAWFERHVLANPPDWTQPKEWGFKDMRLGVLTRDECIHAVWDYFGDHGCFIGGAPMTDGYAAQAMIAPDTTPFERLYFFNRGALLAPVLAHRLRPDVIKAGPIAEHKQKRVFDSMELLDWDTEGDDLCLHDLRHEEHVPEPMMHVPEAFFLEHFPAAERWV